MRHFGVIGAMAGCDLSSAVDLDTPRARQLCPETFNLWLGGDKGLYPFIGSDHPVMRKRQNSHIRVFRYLGGMLVPHVRIQCYKQPFFGVTERDDTRVFYALLALFGAILAVEMILKCMHHKISGT